MNLRDHFFLSALLMGSLSAAEDRVPAGGAFHIQACSSGVDYPDKGDEKLSVSHGGLSFHVKILHPKVVEGPHFSTPFFWVNKQGAEAEFEWDSFVAVKTHMGGVDWNSANRGYFFAERAAEDGKPLRGFLLENGFDNADSGSRGLLLLFDGEKASAWSWVYGREAKEGKSMFRVTTADSPSAAMREPIFTRISSVLEFAREKAGGWTGP